MRGRLLFDYRNLVAILSVLLSAMLLLVSTSSPPIVPIGQVFSFDDGSVVALIGIVVDMSLHDGGSESLVLADITSGATVRVYCDPGLHEQPSHFLSIGDEVRVQGEISNSGTSPIVFATSDSIILSRRAESVLSLEALCQNWILFEGDGFAIDGMIVVGDVAGSFRLSDKELKHCVMLRSDSVDLASYVGKSVKLDAILRLDPDTMSLVLIASSLVPSPP